MSTNGPGRRRGTRTLPLSSGVYQVERVTLDDLADIDLRPHDLKQRLLSFGSWSAEPRAADQSSRFMATARTTAAPASSLAARSTSAWITQSRSPSGSSRV